MLGFIASTAPRWPAGKMRAMKRCRSRSMVVCTTLPDTGARVGAAPASRTTWPRALTSTNRRPSAPAQRIVVLALQAVLAHEAAQPHRREPHLGPLRLGHLADIAHQVRGDAGVGIEPLGLRLDQQARDQQPPLFELRYDIELRVRHDQRGQVGGLAVAGHHARDAGAVELDDRGDARERRAHRRFVAGQQRHGVARARSRR